MGSSPYPNLQIYPTSGLTFPWAEHHPGRAMGSFDAHLGPDGCTLGMLMLIFWADLDNAVNQLLGYSYKSPTGVTPRGGSYLRRKLPWQHPYYNQLWVKRIVSVKGVQLRGTSISDPNDLFTPTLGGAGSGYTPNTGPWSEFQYALLTIEFWRPPYSIRSDLDILDVNGNPMEWLRYTDLDWSVSSQMLTRTQGAFTWLTGPAGFPGNDFEASTGQIIGHQKLTRTWYEIPQASILAKAQDSTPTGLPTNFVYTQTATTNPFNGYTYPANSPIAGCVNSPIGGAVNPGGIVDNPIYRLFGCRIGTLMFEGVELKQRPLQLPPYLMQIPFLNFSEPISQVQYDVILHFDLFDPPTDTAQSLTPISNIGGTANINVVHGHNLMPCASNSLWFPVVSKGTTSGNYMTPFQYADLSDLFQCLL